MKHLLKRPMTAVIWVLAIGLLAASPAIIHMVSADQTPATLPDAQQSSAPTNLGLYGGDTWDIAVDGDYVYTIATSTPNGFFFSTDAGTTWERPSGYNDYGSGQGVEVDYATGTVYVSLGGDLYKSMDHGATLSKVIDNAGFPLLVAQGKVFAGYNNTVKISSDNGATFTSVIVGASSDIGVTSLAASKTTGTFYATVYDHESNVGSLYRSTDSGATWSSMAVIASGTAVTSLATVSANPYDENNLVVANDHHLWQSLDGGATFTEVNHNCNNISTWTASGKWYACSAYSTDHGITWTDMDIHTNVVRGPGKVIAINSQNTDIMYGDCMSGVCISSDAGLTWEYSYTGIKAVNVQAISYTADKNTAWVSSGNGLAMTMDFQSAEPTWVFPVMPCAPERCDASGIGQTVWVKPDDASIVMAGSIGGFIYRSINGGWTWTLASHPTIDVAKFIDPDTSMNVMVPQQFVTDQNDTSAVYLALSGLPTGGAWVGAVLKSTDAGATWTDMALPNDAPASSIAISKTGILYVGTGESHSTLKGVYKYANGVWSALSGIPTDVNINSILIDPENESVVYVAASGDGRIGHDGIYKSSDAGVTWKKAAGLSGYYGFKAITLQRSTTPNTLYVSGRDSANHGVLLKSGDAGENWGLLYQGLKSESFNTAVFDGLVVGSKHGIIAIKSKGKFDMKASAATIKKGKVVSLTGTLKDAATKRVLKNKQIGIYQQIGKKWKLVGAVNTNKKTGALDIKIKPSKTTTYRLTWTPDKKDKVEYASLSKTFTITVKK
jgi:hypothetical protein